MGFFYFKKEEEKEMSKKLYVGNLHFKATEEDLRELFSKSGEVESVKIIKDLSTGSSRGFGFVEMSAEEDAQKAIKTLNGYTFMERKLNVNEAKTGQKRNRRDERGRAGGGRGKGTSRGWR